LVVIALAVAPAVAQNGSRDDSHWWRVGMGMVIKLELLILKLENIRRKT
jgi:hypothetical protein